MASTLRRVGKWWRGARIRPVHHQHHFAPLLEQGCAEFPTCPTNRHSHHQSWFSWDTTTIRFGSEFSVGFSRSEHLRAGSGLFFGRPEAPPGLAPFIEGFL